MVILIKYLTALCFHFPISIEYCQLLKAKIYFPDLHLCNSGEVNITDHILCRGVSLVQNPEVGFLSQRHVHPEFLQVQPRHALQLCWLTFPHTHVLLVLVVLFSAFLFFFFFKTDGEKLCQFGFRLLRGKQSFLCLESFVHMLWPFFFGWGTFQ